jgi:hypothetical protein
MPVYVFLMLAATPSTLGLDGGMSLDSERWGPSQNPAALSFGQRYLYMGGVYRQLQAEDYVLGLGAVDAVSGPVAGSLGFLVQQPEGTLVAEMGLGLLLSPQLAAGLAVSKPNEDWSELSARTGVALTQGPVVLGMHYDFGRHATDTPWTFSALFRRYQSGFRASIDLKNDLSSVLGLLVERQQFRIEGATQLDESRQVQSYSLAVDYLEKGGWLGLAYRRETLLKHQFIGFRFAAQLRRKSR